MESAQQQSGNQEGRRKPGRPRGGDKLKTREKLLDSARKLLKSKSINEISLREVAINAGLSPAVTRYYFDSVENFREEVLRHVWGRLKIPETLVERKGASLEEHLASNIHRHVRIFVESPELSHLLVQSMLFQQKQSIRFLNEEVFGPMMEALNPVFAEGVEQGVFNEIDTMDFAMVVIGATTFYSLASRDMAPAFGKKRVTKKDKQKFCDDVTSVAMNYLVKSDSTS